MEVSRFIGIVEGLQAVYLRLWYEMNEFALDSKSYKGISAIMNDVEMILDKIMAHVNEDKLKLKAPGG